MKFLSIDSSLANTGIAIGEIDQDGNILVKTIALHETKKSKNKQVRASSDTIDRCSGTFAFVYKAIREWCPDIIFAETPSGSQSAAGMKSYGATCQLLASLTPLPIQVTPEEVKKAATGKKTASKADMIAWAVSLYPQLNWTMHRGNLANKNEHVADAIAVAYAGIRTNQFRQLKALYGHATF